MTDKVVVRFLKAWRGYSTDELAAFDQAVVEGLESKGFAEVHQAGGESATKAKGGKGKSQRGASAKAEGSQPNGAGGNLDGAGDGVDKNENGGGDLDEGKP
ncbi:hypothetical protein J3D48_004297 [Pseudomonas fluorescens]|uniref:hypothetical protein n=1 Tax=Pseudomonas fluorescens TaxID=294 RepID=UPI0020A07681|nr:hypothetical protein [Pseudomonas fluorescens]MCP1487984.1 hypothetical protein [Pseudomonas fluorescens]